MNGVIHMVQSILDGIFEIWHSLTTKAVLPPITVEVLQLSATQLAEKIRAREITSEFVVKAFIKRIQEVNPALNCFITENNHFEEALREAREVDKKLDNDPYNAAISPGTQPFLGVPFTSKEAFQIKGCLNSSGLVARKGFIAEEDAPVVHQLKAAGAIALGVTVVPELCMWWETSNNVYGRTNNAYDSRRIVGGSSGGEACLISAAGSVMGVGSDIGGSIRMPAFFNGIFGHKPSRYLVSNEGQFPGDSRDDKYLTTGPLCRHAVDIIPMLKVMAGEENSKSHHLDSPIDFAAFQLRVISIPDVGKALGVSPISPEQRDSQNQVAEFLQKEINAKVEIMYFDELEESFAMWNSSLSLTGSPSFCQLLGSPSEEPIQPWKELFLWLICLSKHTLPAIGLALTEKIDTMPTSEKEKFRAKAESLEKKIKELIGDAGILLFPSSADYAYYHNQPIYKSFNCVYTMILNILGFPVTQVPLGLGKKGVPLGIQVVADHDNDRLSIAVAHLLEKRFGGWVKPQL